LINDGGDSILKQGEKWNMNGPLNPSLKRPLLLIGAGIGIYLVVSYFFGVLVGFIVNTALFIGIIFYIRKKQTAGLRSFGFENNNSNSNNGYHIDTNTKLKYGCISCGAEVKGSKCKKCGSKMKKPIF
jgi:hypothetical protein